MRYRNSMNNEDKADITCPNGEHFFGRLEKLGDVLWLVHESNGLYLPAQHPQSKQWLFEEVTWTCGKDEVTYRNSPNFDDTVNEKVVPYACISAMPAASQPGWLQEASSKLYLPMNNPSTGEPLFTRGATATVVAGSAPIPMQMGNATGPAQAPKPAGVPPEATFLHEKYIGPTTMAAGCAGCLCCGLPGLIICLIQLDERDVWITPDGKRWDLMGKRIEQ